MDSPSDFKSTVEKAAARVEDCIHRYREAARAVRNPAVGRLMQSVLDQKESQRSTLRVVAESEAPGPAPGVVSAADPPKPVVPAEPGEDPSKTALRMVLQEESLQEALYHTLQDAAGSEDNRQKLHSLAEGSHKIGGWARDHLELLSLF